MMETKMETTGILSGYIRYILGLHRGIMENKMETTDRI